MRAVRNLEYLKLIISVLLKENWKDLWLEFMIKFFGQAKIQARKFTKSKWMKKLKGNRKSPFSLHFVLKRSITELSGYLIFKRKKMFQWLKRISKIVSNRQLLFSPFIFHIQLILSTGLGYSFTCTSSSSSEAILLERYTGIIAVTM